MLKPRLNFQPFAGQFSDCVVVSWVPVAEGIPGQDTNCIALSLRTDTRTVRMKRLAKKTATQRIKCTPTNRFYRLDSDLSTGSSYPFIEQVDLVDSTNVQWKFYKLR